jgi:small-conductance mechanosensitive channel
MSQFLSWTLYGNTLGTWLAAGAVAAATLTVLVLARIVVVSRLVAFAGRTRNSVDDVAAGLARGTRLFFLLVVALAAGAGLLALPPVAQRLVTGLAMLALVIQGALWGNIAIGHVVKRQVAHRVETDPGSAATLNALGFLARLILWSVLFLLALDNFGIDITALVAGLGIGGVAVALAVQNVLGDLFASLSIVLDRPFVIGDFIIVDDLMGTVEHVGLKTTRIRSLHGEQIVFSNNDLLDSRVRNYKRMRERRIVFVLGVTYDTPPEKVAAIPGLLREAVELQERVRFDRAHFKAYGAFSLDFEVVYYVLDPDYNTYMDVQQEINLAILRSFAAGGIEFAFPTQTLHLHAASRANGSQLDVGVSAVGR